MNSKIGILTRRAAYNYGSTLQAYAMSRMIQNLGYPNVVLDYDEYAHDIRWMIRPIIEDIMHFLFKSSPFLFKRLFPNKYRYLEIRHMQKFRFHLFEKEFIPLTRQTYKNSKQLAQSCKKYEMLICGSDQIWNPFLYDPVFLFDFIEQPSSINTIAYAPSLGVSEKEQIPEHEINLIKKIQHISCREEQGAKILSEITGTEVNWVLDPTLMLSINDWNNICKDETTNNGKPYILCYFLDNKNIPHDFIFHLKEKLGIMVLNIQSHNWLNKVNAEKQMYDVGPCEFLTLVKHASWVCTNSFHCAIFSFIFKRNFSVFERFKSTDTENQNSRIYSLLKILKLENQLAKEEDIPDLDKVVDFLKSENELRKWQEKSRLYLINSISRK